MPHYCNLVQEFNGLVSKRVNSNVSPFAFLRFNAQMLSASQFANFLFLFFDFETSILIQDQVPQTFLQTKIFKIFFDAFLNMHLQLFTFIFIQ